MNLHSEDASKDVASRFISTIACRHSRWGALCPGTFRAPAHDWGQVLMFEGKNGPHFGSPALLMKLACLRDKGVNKKSISRL